MTCGAPTSSGDSPPALEEVSDWHHILPARRRALHQEADLSVRTNLPTPGKVETARAGCDHASGNYKGRIGGPPQLKLMEDFLSNETLPIETFRSTQCNDPGLLPADAEDAPFSEDPTADWVPASSTSDSGSTSSPCSSFEDDAASVAAVVARTRGAAERFILRHDAFLRAVIRASSQAARPLLDDLTHEVYVHLWRDEFRVLRQWQQEHPLRAYLRSVTRRLVWERLSRLAPVRQQPKSGPMPVASVPPEQTPMTPEDEAAAGEVLAFLLHALDGLNADHREILELRYYQDLSYREIAEVLGITPTNAGVRLSRAHAQLKRAFSHSLEEIDWFALHEQSCARAVIKSAAAPSYR